MFLYRTQVRERKNYMAKPKLWLGLAGTGVALLTLVLAAQQIANMNAGLINDALGLSTKKIEKIESDEVEGSAYAEEDGSLSNKGWKKMIQESYKFCEEAVEQGSVLFKNDNDALPLKANERRVTLFGRGSKNLFMRSGAGGAAPNNNLVVKLDAAFESNGFEINHTVFDAYGTVSGMTSPNTTVEQSFTSNGKDFYTDEMKDSFADYGDAAIVTFVRIGTENSDPSAGKLDLNNEEKQLLQMIKEYKDNGTFKKIIVMINSPLSMSVDWVNNEDYGIDACVYMGVPGYYGVGGIVHVLMGKDADGNFINPSGHAVNTFAASASSSAAYQNFGDNNVVVYKEGVYVGYKYYETRYEDCVLGQGNADGSAGVYKSTSGWNYAEEVGCPFGYGMSYTKFEQKINSLTYNAEKDTIDAEVEVKNAGYYAGKASVQLYVQAPYTQFDKDNGLGKSAIALMAYDKVDVAAGGTAKVNLSFDRYFLATYDYKINKSYILEDGTYYFAVGNGAHEALNNIISVKDSSAELYDHNGAAYTGVAAAVKTLDFEEDLNTYRVSHYDPTVDVTNQFDDADYNHFATGSNQITYLDRQNWQGTWPTKTTSNPAPSSEQDMSNYYKSAPASGPQYTAGNGTVYNVDLGEEKITFPEMAKIPLEGVIEDEESRFNGQNASDVWDKFISQMNLDDLIISVSDNRGILDVLKVMKPGNSVAEGPEGLLSKYQYGDKRWATGFPTGPTYTGTWDHNMQANFGAFYGEDALFCGVACVNAPGANINRTPYGSRASEYMSEDGILNYNTAANIVGAARKKGLIMNIKHCFLNNQETGRQRVATFCNEQAIREIYLRPFEGALTKGKGLGIMTSYNRIGVRYAACHEPLMMNVMRGEWKYRGLIIDDALTGSNNDSYSNGPAMLHSGTDMFCLDGGRGGQLKSWVTSNNDGTLLKDLQRANKYIMYAMSKSWMGGVTPMTEEEIKENMNPWWKKTVSGVVIGTGSIAVILVGLYAAFEILDLVRAKAQPSEAMPSEPQDME